MWTLRCNILDPPIDGLFAGLVGMAGAVALIGLLLAGRLRHALSGGPRARPRAAGGTSP